MKILYTTFFLCLLGSQLFAQDFTSKDNHIGKWQSNGTWEGGTFPSNTGEAGDSIHIHGTVTLEDHLVLENRQMVVYDTLWVQGNLTIRNGASLTVNAGGILFVTGDLIVRDGTINNSGNTAIYRYDIQGGIIKNENQFYIFCETNMNNCNNHVYGTVTTPPPGFRTEAQFQIDHEDLYNQIQNGTLPIELLSFTGTAQNDGIYLDWVTAWEENFDFFTVERAGSDLQFKAIGTVKGNGNTVAEVAYSFTDTDPLSGQAFYRLKATDFDGSFEHHKIISVHFDGLAARVNTTKVYPNPVTNHALKVETSEDTISEIRLLDLSGRIMYTQKVEIGTNEIHLPESIKAGSYVLVLLHSQGKQHQEKIMVL